MTALLPRPALAVGAVGVCVALPSLRGPFLLDDLAGIARNDALQSQELWEVFASPGPYEYLPVRDAVLVLEVLAFGQAPLGYHAVSIGLYGLVCALTWLAVRGVWTVLGGSDSRDVATWAALGFAVHPAHAEAFGWVSSQKDLLAACFGLGSLAALCAHPPRRALSVGLLAAAALSKASAVVLGPAALLLGVATRRPWLGAPHLVVAAGAGAVAVGAGRALDVQVGAWGVDPVLSVRILGALAAVSVGVLPPSLVRDLEGPALGAVALGSGIAVAAAGVAAYLWRAPRAAVGVALFALCCGPYLQLVPFRTWSLASDRFALLGSLVVTTACSVALLRVRAGPVPMGALAVLGAALTTHQASLWAAPERLFAQTARRSPTSARAVSLHLGAGGLTAGGDARALVSRVADPDARAILDRWIDAHSGAPLDPRTFPPGAEVPPGLSMLLGAAHEAAGRGAEAACAYGRARGRADTMDELLAAEAAHSRVLEPFAAPLAVADAPSSLDARARQAALQLELCLYDEAISGYRALAEQAPGSGGVHYNLGIALLRRGRAGAAAEALERAIDLGIVTADAWNHLGRARAQLGASDAAVAAWHRALATDAGHWHAAVNLARLHRDRGDPRSAEEALAEARRRTHGTPAAAAVPGPASRRP